MAFIPCVWVCVCVFVCLFVYICACSHEYRYPKTRETLDPLELSWSYRCLWATYHRSWEQNPGPFKDQYVLFNSWAIFQLLFHSILHDLKTSKLALLSSLPPHTCMEGFLCSGQMRTENALHGSCYTLRGLVQCLLIWPPTFLQASVLPSFQCMVQGSAKACRWAEVGVETLPYSSLRLARLWETQEGSPGALLVHRSLHVFCFASMSFRLQPVSMEE